MGMYLLTCSLQIMVYQIVSNQELKKRRTGSLMHLHAMQMAPKSCLHSLLARLYGRVHSKRRLGRNLDFIIKTMRKHGRQLTYPSSGTRNSRDRIGRYFSSRTTSPGMLSLKVFRTFALRILNQISLRCRRKVWTNKNTLQSIRYE